MRRFALIHDGSDQGWQATFLAFHVAAQLGASLLLFLGDSPTDEKLLVQLANQVEVGGRAAGVVIETHFLSDFSVSLATENVPSVDGLFIPHRLIQDGETALRLLEALSCPLWIIAKEFETNDLAVLVNDPAEDAKMIHYATMLAHRLQQNLIGIRKESNFASTLIEDPILSWVSIPNFSPSSLTLTQKQIESGLLIMPSSRISLVDNWQFNYLIYPAE